jgi:hypothetical protein
MSLSLRGIRNSLYVDCCVPSNKSFTLQRTILFRSTPLLKKLRDKKKRKRKRKIEIIIKILGQCLSCPHLHLMTFFHWTHSHKFIYQLATVRKQKQSHFNDITINQGPSSYTCHETSFLHSPSLHFFTNVPTVCTGTC